MTAAEKRMNHKKLQELFDELNLKHFGAHLPQIPLRFSGRLKTTGGQYFKRPVQLIQISTRYLTMTNSWEEIRDTLGHEMVHYWLDYQGKPCGHTPEFRKKLNECGFQRYSRLTPVKARYHYQCPGCSTSYYRKRKGLWSCGPCSGQRFNAKFKLLLVDDLKSPQTSLLSMLFGKKDRHA